MTRPRLLDLFCGAGGCSMGYYRAGFDVIGCDIKPQKRYPFDFIEQDAFECLRNIGQDFDLIHASPPCQAYSRATAWRGDRSSHSQLIADVRRLCANRPYVIENVADAGPAMLSPVLLCGTMFGLPFQRHRYFEIGGGMPFILTTDCKHSPSDCSFDHGGKQPESAYREAIGVPWMTVLESRQAIPPTYTEFIGRQLIAALANREPK